MSTSLLELSALLQEVELRSHAPWATQELRRLERFLRERFLELRVERDLEGARAVVLLGRSVPVAPLRAALLPLLRGAASVRLRSAGDASPLLELLERAPSLRETVSVQAGGTGREFLERALREGADHVELYGSDETVRSVRETLPRGLRFEGRAHGFGVAILGSAPWRQELAAELSRSVLAFDGVGCLSPQTLFVPRGILEPCVPSLLEALEAGAAPIADAGTAQALRAWRVRAAVEADSVRATPRACLACYPAPLPRASPGHGHLSLATYASIDELARALEPHARWLTAVGTNASAGELSSLAVALGDARRSPLGTMQDAEPDPTEEDPARAGYADPRAPVREGA